MVLLARFAHSSLRSHTLLTPFLLSSDAFDVLLLPDAADIAARYADNFKGRIVIGAELACSPDKSLDLVYPGVDKTKPFQYVNSGSYIGLVKDVKMMLEDVSADIAKHHAFSGASPLALDDQRWFTRYYIRNPGVIERDEMGILFHTLHDIDPKEFTNIEGEPGRLYSNWTKSTPCLIHGNGNGLSTFHDLVRKVGEVGWPPGADKTSIAMGATSSPLEIK